jgi:hypothetical protein
LQDKCRDILIEGIKDRHRALEGDEVVIKLNPESEWKVREKFLLKVFLLTLWICLDCYHLETRISDLQVLARFVFIFSAGCNCHP